VDHLSGSYRCDYRVSKLTVKGLLRVESAGAMSALAGDMGRGGEGRDDRVGCPRAWGRDMHREVRLGGQMKMSWGGERGCSGMCSR